MKKTTIITYLMQFRFFGGGYSGNSRTFEWLSNKCEGYEKKENSKNIHTSRSIMEEEEERLGRCPDPLGDRITCGPRKEKGETLPLKLRLKKLLEMEPGQKKKEKKNRRMPDDRK